MDLVTILLLHSTCSHVDPLRSSQLPLGRNRLDHNIMMPVVTTRVAAGWNPCMKAFKMSRGVAAVLLFGQAQRALGKATAIVSLFTFL